MKQQQGAGNKVEKSQKAGGSEVLLHSAHICADHIAMFSSDLPKDN